MFALAGNLLNMVNMHMNSCRSPPTASYLSQAASTALSHLRAYIGPSSAVKMAPEQLQLAPHSAEQTTCHAPWPYENE